MDPQNQPPTQPEQTTQQEITANQLAGQNNFKLWYGIIGTMVILMVTVGSLWVFSIIKKQTVSTKTIQPQPTQASIQSPTSQLDEFAGWKRYRDEKNGFEFKYPPIWIEENGKLNSPNNEMLNIFTQEGESVGVGFPCDKIITEEKINIDNTTATKTTTEWNEEEPCGSKPANERGAATRVGFTRNNTWYLISFNYSPANKQPAVAVFDQILSTFRFTEQNQQDDTSNWKTERIKYVEEERQDNQFITSTLLLKYPQDWTSKVIPRKTAWTKYCTDVEITDPSLSSTKLLISPICNSWAGENEPTIPNDSVIIRSDSDEFNERTITRLRFFDNTNNRYVYVNGFKETNTMSDVMYFPFKSDGLEPTRITLSISPTNNESLLQTVDQIIKLMEVVYE